MTTEGTNTIEPSGRDARPLVERLRMNAARMSQYVAYSSVIEPDKLCNEAADEIEHWQAEARAAVMQRDLERERCAAICERLAVMSLDPMVCRGSAEECAEAIRFGEGLWGGER